MPPDREIPPADLIGRRDAIALITTSAGLLLGRRQALAEPPARSSPMPQTSVLRESSTILSNDVVPKAVLRHGAYICLVRTGDRRSVTEAPVEALAQRLGFQNEFVADAGHPAEAFAFLRRVDATQAEIADNHLFHAEAIIHVASPTAERVEQFCAEASRLLGTATRLAVLQGVVRPRGFTGEAMHNFAYAQQVQQQPGDAMPHVFIVPMRKTAEWWAKSWMERHTYSLPRYDDTGRMLHEGHALAAAAGIAHLMRRTYKHSTEPAPDGAYDFVTYFECADASVPQFFAVCAALRDVSRNPEWKFVHEGPTWHGHRVRTWSELFM
jgi:hypothetical protein